VDVSVPGPHYGFATCGAGPFSGAVFPAILRHLTSVLRTLPQMAHLRAALLAVCLLATTSAAAFADDPASSSGNSAAQWTAYGYTITAPSSMWPMLELLHSEHFDWELASASRRPTPLVWANLPVGTYGQYSPALNVVRLSGVLQNSSVEVATAFLAHELTHLNDDLNGKLGDATGSACYEAEARAFVNEANFWQMVVGPLGKTSEDPIEKKENAKMFAFVGHSHFADLVVRTTASYVRQCGADHSN
jgi:hypothetical protein